MCSSQNSRSGAACYGDRVQLQVAGQPYAWLLYASHRGSVLAILLYWSRHDQQRQDHPKAPGLISAILFALYASTSVTDWRCGHQSHQLHVRVHSKMHRWLCLQDKLLHAQSLMKANVQYCFCLLCLRHAIIQCCEQTQHCRTQSAACPTRLLPLVYSMYEHAAVDQVIHMCVGRSS